MDVSAMHPTIQHVARVSSKTSMHLLKLRVLYVCVGAFVCQSAAMQCNGDFGAGNLSEPPRPASVWLTI